MSDENRGTQSSNEFEQIGTNLSNTIINSAKKGNAKFAAFSEENVLTKVGAHTNKGSIKINTQNITGNTFIVQSKVTAVEIANNVPRRSMGEFIGRERILEQLHEFLTATNRLVNIALYGTGGIGKTEIALQYAQKYTEHYSGGICWLSCRDTDIKNQILNFARSYLGIELPKESDSEHQLDVCWSQWRKGDVLIVFDDVPDVSSIVSFLPPAYPRIKVLLTTRQSYGSAIFKFIPIDVLEETAALHLLKSMIGEADPRIIQEEQARELCLWLDCLPLGLELVGRYLERRRDVTLAEMLERLKSEKLQQEAMKEGIAAALEVSWSELSSGAKTLSYNLSLFSLAPIPWWMVECVQPNSQPKELEKWRDDELHRFSLLQRQESGIYQFHHLTREFIQGKLNDAEVAEDLKRLFCQNMVCLIKKLLNNMAPEEAATTPQAFVLVHIEEIVAVTPHLIEAEDLFSIYQTLMLVYAHQGLYREATLWGDRCRSELSTRIDQELVFLNLYRLAGVYSNRGKYEETEQLLLEVLNLAETAFSSDVYETISAEILSELGSVRATRGKFQQAEEDCQNAIELKEKLNGSESTSVASGLLALGEVCRIRGRYEEAEKHYTRAFEIYSTVIEIEGYDNINPVYIATGFINISALLLEQGQNDGCEFFSQQALEIVGTVIGNEHPLYATCLVNLASAHLNRGDHHSAEDCCRIVIALNEEKNNTGHPSYAAGLINLATIYMAQGRFDEAIEQYEYALNVRQQFLGEQHDQVAEVLVLLAIPYLALNRVEDAERMLSKGQEMYAIALGTDHPKYGEILSQLAHVRINKNEYDEAEQLLRDAIGVFESAYGRVHPKICEKQAILAVLLIIREKFEEASTLFYQSLELAKQVYGEDNPNVCEYIFFIAELNHSHGAKGEADRLYAQAIGIYEQGRSKKINPDFSQGLMTLIEIYESQRRYKEVELIYGRLIDITRKLLGNDNSNLALLLTRLANLRLDASDYEGGAKLHKEALEIRKHFFSENHPLIATSMVNLAYAYQVLNRTQEAKDLYAQALEIRIIEYGNSHQQVTLVKNALARLDYSLEKSEQTSIQALPVGEPTPRSNKSTFVEVETNTLQSQSNEVVNILHQDVATKSKTAESKAEEIKVLEQKRTELESQLLQLDSQKQVLEAEIERYQKKSQADQANLLKITEQLIRLSHAERAKLAEPLSLVLADLEEQQQEYQHAWDSLQKAIQKFNTYQEETNEVRFHLEAHYQADDSLTQALPLNRQKVEHILQVVCEQLADLDQELANARSQHERSQQKSIIRF